MRMNVAEAVPPVWVNTPARPGSKVLSPRPTKIVSATVSVPSLRLKVPRAALALPMIRLPVSMIELPATSSWPIPVDLAPMVIVPSVGM